MLCMPSGFIIILVSPKPQENLLWPSTIRDYSVRPLPFLLGNAPTVGQALYIAMFSILTLILCCVNYKAF